MFGFLNPPTHDRNYRAVYSRCCQHQRLHHGLRSLPFLSYESVFLYSFWLDVVGLAPASLPQRACCQLERIGRSDIPDGQAGEFCSAVAMVLTDAKIDDDIRDSGGSWRMRALRHVMRGQTTRGLEYFRSLDPAFEETISGFVDAHLQLERNGSEVSFERFLAPTSAAFEYMFGLMAHLPDMEQERELLRAVGHGVGSALLAYDCAADWQSDRDTGQYNPLPDVAAVEEAVAFSRGSLQRVLSLCRQRFSEDAESVRILSAVANEVQNDSCSAEGLLAKVARAKRLVASALGSVSTAFAQNSESKSDGDACLGCCAIICCLICVGNACGSKTEKVGQIDVYKKTGCC